MRTITAGHEAVISGGQQCYFLRVSVKDSGGTFRDLTTYPEINMVESAEWTDDLDNPGAHATVTLIREQDYLSLAPLMQSSPLNLGFAHGASYAPLLQVNREIKIEVAVEPGDAYAASSWLFVFHGYIDEIDAGRGSFITLQCRDLSAALLDTFIEWERWHGCTADGATEVGCREWMPNVVVATNEYFVPSETKRGARPRVYKATVGGTTSSVEPAWPTSSTVDDDDGSGHSGTPITWTHKEEMDNSGQAIAEALQGVLNANGQSAVTLATSGSPSWNLTGWKQQREPLLEALRSIALQIGWDVRYKWDSGSSTFKLTLWAPTRSGATSSRTFASTEVLSYGAVKVDNASIRNVVRVIYPDGETRRPDGAVLRKEYTSTNGSASVTKYGRRFMEVIEAKTSNIDTLTEATRLAEAITSDLMEPTLEMDVELAYGFPWAEVGDLYTFSTNLRHFSASQELAVHRVTHKCAGGAMYTTLAVRGAPGLGPARLLPLDSRAIYEPAHSLNPGGSVAGVDVSVTAAPGGAQINVTTGTDPGTSEQIINRHTYPEEYEVHISTSSSYTPSAATLHSVQQSREVTVTDLIPGTTYYATVVPRLRNAGRLAVGPPSAITSFVAGQNSSGHLKGDVEWGRLPLNGGFETQTNANGFPDHWFSDGAHGDWGTEYTLVSDANGLSGDKYLKVDASVTYPTPAMYSATFPVEEGALYRFSVLRKTSAGGAGNLFVGNLEYLEYDGSVVGSSSGAISFDLDDNVGTWIREFAFDTAPSDARYARISWTGDLANSTQVFYLDDWRVEKYYVEPGPVTEPSLSNSWVSYGGAYAAFGYWKDICGVVHAHGAVKSGTTGVIYTLPAGYCPAATLTFVGWSAGAAIPITVDSSGVVTAGAGYVNTDVNVYLNFRAA